MGTFIIGFTQGFNKMVLVNDQFLKEMVTSAHRIPRHMEQYSILLFLILNKLSNSWSHNNLLISWQIIVNKTFQYFGLMWTSTSGNYLSLEYIPL